MNNEKNLLRHRMKKLAHPSPDSTNLSMRLRKRLEAWIEWEKAVSVCAFSPLSDEPRILDPWPAEKQIALPVIEGNHLSAKWVAGFSCLVTGAFGIQEPPSEAPTAGTEFDLILVPGMAFDRRGGRLGRGKGYYDRFLEKTTGFRVGICFDDRIVDKVPGESHDAGMDAIVTPSAIFLCES